MPKFTELYYRLNGTLSVGDELDQPRIDHVLEHYPTLKTPDIIRALIDNDMKRKETPPSWANKLIEKLENIKVVAANGGNVEEAIEEAKGFNFGDDDFFGGEEL